ncbi:MAG: GNAT family N-acetyltransferase [Verrucomicrobiota bacterium JB023]|nr:GNAT family N-acetyltransferase [Verrucomicrobiota bacterium JB023]
MGIDRGVMGKTSCNHGIELPTIAAGRVRLRSLTEDDVPSLFEIFGDHEVVRYWGHSVLPDLAAARTLLEDIREHLAQKTLFQWGVEVNASGEIVGTCTLASLDFENRRAELGFALAKRFWFHGYMAEALPVLLSFAFGEMKLHRVWADTDPRNDRSIRVLERLGFRREGVLREHYLIHGESQDAVVYGLLNSDWRLDGHQ